MAYLTFPLEDGRDIVVNIDGPITLGCAEDNEVVLEDGEVDARHAEIVPNPAGLYSLRDLGSRSGTIANGLRVESCLLSDGDELSFGNVRCRFTLAEPGEDLPVSHDAEHAELQRKLAELQQSCEAANVRHGELESLVQSLAEQEASKRSSLERLRQDHSELEELLLQSKSRRDDLKGEHHTLSEELKAATANLTETRALHEELSSRTATHEKELQTLEQRIQQIRADHRNAELEMAAAEEGHRASQNQMADERNRLGGEVRALDQQLSEQREALDAAITNLRCTKQENEELRGQNALLAGAEQRLAVVNQLIQQSEIKGTRLRTDNAKLETDQSRLQGQLNDLQTLEADAQKRYQALEEEGQTRRETLAQLVKDEQAEQLRFDEARKAHAAAEAASESAIASLKVTLDRRRHDLVQAEARLATLLAWENDLDLRYSRLSSLPEETPEAREVWRGIQDLKKAIAEALPPRDIQAKPETRMQVVPRAKPKS